MTCRYCDQFEPSVPMTPTPSTRSTGSEGAEAPDDRTFIDCGCCGESHWFIRAAPPSAPDPERALCPGNCLKQHAHYYAHPDPEGLPLDRRLLFEAIEAVTEEWDDDNAEPSVIFAGSQYDLRERIAAEYARLSMTLIAVEPTDKGGS